MSGRPVRPRGDGAEGMSRSGQHHTTAGIGRLTGRSMQPAAPFWDSALVGLFATDRDSSHRAVRYLHPQTAGGDVGFAACLIGA
jgi:hypothetical protein